MHENERNLTPWSSLTIYPYSLVISAHPVSAKLKSVYAKANGWRLRRQRNFHLFRIFKIEDQGRLALGKSEDKFIKSWYSKLKISIMEIVLKTHRNLRSWTFHLKEDYGIKFLMFKHIRVRRCVLAWLESDGTTRRSSTALCRSWLNSTEWATLCIPWSYPDKHIPSKSKCSRLSNSLHRMSHSLLLHHCWSLLIFVILLVQINYDATKYVFWTKTTIKSSCMAIFRNSLPPPLSIGRPSPSPLLSRWTWSF